MAKAKRKEEEKENMRNSKKTKCSRKCTSEKQKLRNEQKKECMRRLRQARKNDPIEYEEAKRLERERYYRRKQEGKIKSITEMTEREKRNVRKQWKIRSKNYYEAKKRAINFEKMLADGTPPSTPPPITEENNMQQQRNISNTPQVSGRISAGKKRRRRNRDQLKATISELEKKLRKEKASKEKYKKRLQRMENNKDTPRKKVKNLLRGQTVSTAVKKKLLFGEVMSSQIKENFSEQKSPADKRKFVSNVTGHIVKKYKYQRYVESLSSSRISRTKTKTGNAKIKEYLKIKIKVKHFFETDEASRICPGKKDTITFKKIKKQKRYLNYSLKQLYRKFLDINKDTHISYSLFCKMRPFWVVASKAKDRETCLCEIHTNFELLVSKLKILNIIKERTPEDILKSLICSETDTKEMCLERKCDLCKNKDIKMLDFDNNEQTGYEKWITKKEKLIIKGKEKICSKKVKELINCNKGELFSAFKDSMPKFISHNFNIMHQYREINHIKKHLSENEILLYIDFSENYNCKYAAEVQSAHFGGSKPQVTLHTVVTYHKCSRTSLTIPTSYCTLSHSLRHDPSAICAHLDPIIKEIKRIIPNLKSAHFLSDGPTTQYKNKTMFYLMATYLAEKLGVDELRWHYSETHHGKGAPDGIGGCIKRTADDMVAKGTDIPNFQVLTEKLKDMKGIQIFSVDEATISNIDLVIPKELLVFKGTTQVHEITWIKQEKFSLNFRKLTCTNCNAGQECTHYNLGQITYQENSNESILLKNNYNQFSKSNYCDVIFIYSITFS